MLNKIYAKNNDLVSRKITDEVILVPISKKVADVNAVYLLKNEVAQRIWELMDGKRNLGAIGETIYQEFEVDKKTAAQDILKLTGQLEKEGCIIEVKP